MLTVIHGSQLCGCQAFGEIAPYHSKETPNTKNGTVRVVREMDDGHCIMSLPVFFPAADSTGTHSLYTTYKDYELMFHVSTLLPYTPNNKQQVRTESPAF